MRTPLRASPWLSAIGGGEVRLKLETLQPTFSYKIRGAFNAALHLAERAGDRPALVTASAGNHGRALARAARTCGMPLTVYASGGAPAVKLAAMRDEGADLRLCRDYDEAERRAKAHAAAGEAIFVSPYAHPDVIAGAGTVGLEIVDEWPDVDTIVAAVGGGGLISGLALVGARLRPDDRSRRCRGRSVGAVHRQPRRGADRRDRRRSHAGGRPRRQPRPGRRRRSTSCDRTSTGSCGSARRTCDRQSAASSVRSAWSWKARERPVWPRCSRAAGYQGTECRHRAVRRQYRRAGAARPASGSGPGPRRRERVHDHVDAQVSGDKETGQLFPGRRDRRKRSKASHGATETRRPTEKRNWNTTATALERLASDTPSCGDRAGHVLFSVRTTVSPFLRL